MSRDKPIEVKFSAEIKGLLEGLKSAEEHLGTATEAMRGDLGAMIESFEKFGVAAVGVGAVGMVFEGLKEAVSWVAEAAEHTNQLARSFEGLEFQTGASLHELNQYKVTMQMTGGSVDELQSWLMGLTRGIRSNSEVFIANGIAVNKAALEHMTFENQLKGVLEVLEGEENATRRNELAVAMLGRGGLAVVPQMRRFLETLEEGKKANDELGDSITHESIRAMQDMEKATGKLDATMDKVKSKAQETGVGFSIAMKGMKLAWLDFVGALADHENDLGYAVGASVERDTVPDVKWAPEPKEEKEHKATNTPDEVAEEKAAQKEAEDAARAAAEREAQVQKAIQKNRDQDRQKSEDMATHDMLRGLEERGRAANEFAKSLEEAEKRTNEMARASTAVQISEAKSAYAARAQEIDMAVALGEMSFAQELEARKALIDGEAAQEKLALQAKINEWNQERGLHLAEIIKTQGEIKAVEDKARLEKAKLDGQEMLRAEQVWKRGIDAMTAGWDSGIQKMLHGEMSLTTGFHNAMKQMEDVTEKALINMGLQWVKYSALRLVEGEKAHMTNVMTDAKDAASGAYASAAKIPYIGWILAPVAAAGAFAATMAFAEGGWDRVPSDQVAMIHKNEMVLSAPYAEGLRSIINNYHSGGGAAPGGGGGGNTIHIHAMDAKSFQGFLGRNQGALLKVLGGAARNGRTS